MVCSCCAYNCTNRFKKGSGLSFHSFPKDPLLKKKWIIALKRKHFVPTSASKLCSQHFLSTDFLHNFGKISLMPQAVPSVFNFPSNLQKRTTKKRKTRSVNLGLDSIPISSISTKGNEVEPCLNKEPMPGTSSQSLTEISPATIENTDKQSNRNTHIVKRKRRCPIYFGDFKISDTKCPKTAAEMWKVANNTINQQRRTIKYLRNKNYRFMKRIKSLEDLTTHLKDSKYISNNCYSILQECIPQSEKQILLRQLNLSSEKKYPEELRIFALTLNFYSSSAYNYVRKTFAKNLPHPKTLQKWYRAVDGSPGYTKESLQAIQIKVQECAKQGKSLVCSLVMDEMAVRQHIQWNGKRQLGYINYGLGIDSDSLPVAKEAIVFLLVGINCRWKIPIAYFLINGLTGEEKANLINGCLVMTHDLGVVISSITFDGAASNLAMATHLGCNLSPNKLVTHFPHPLTKELIFIIFDMCHMIKLIRNTLGDWGILHDKDGNSILWDYLVFLVELQEKAGLHAATKLRRRHLNYAKEKMKVKLAVQTFSDSVADALDYCSIDLQLEQFKGATFTANFCRIMNNIFDIMNTRNTLSKSIYKRSLSADNRTFLKDHFAQTREYITTLKDKFGTNILHTKRKTGFLGILINMNSIEGIVDEHIIKKEHLKYLLTYKLSQDHLEMFFSNIRARGGFNNNPTAAQFESAYKKILVHTELSSSEAANCLALDETSILNVTSYSKKTSDVLDFISTEDIEIHQEIFGLTDLSPYVTDVVEYIAGFVCKKLVAGLNCNTCAAALTHQNSLSALLNRKNKGGLMKPTNDVIYICKIAEKVARIHIKNLSKGNPLNQLIIMSVRQINFNLVFNNLSEHILDQDPVNNHLIQIVYQILKTYFTIRLHHQNNSLNEVKDRIRHMYSKLILFKHQ